MSTKPSPPVASPPSCPSPPKTARFSDFLPPTPSLDAHGSPADPPAARVGLYETFVRSPEPLYLDARERPGMYPRETELLLERLVASGAQPTPDELRRLDDAVLLFTDPRPPRAAPKVEVAPAPKAPKKERAAPKHASFEPPDLPKPPEGPDPPAFWWL